MGLTLGQMILETAGKLRPECMELNGTTTTGRRVHDSEAGS